MYLLEKCRVTKHEKGERSFHALHQLCAAPEPVRKKLHLDVVLGGEKAGEGGLASRFRYLCSVGEVAESVFSIDGVDDAEAFLQTDRAMRDMYAVASGEATDASVRT